MNALWKIAVACLCIAAKLNSVAQDTEMMRTAPGIVESIAATYTVDPGGELTIDADFGSVQIETSATNRVKILIEKRLKEGTEEQARRAFEEVDVKTEQQGSDVYIWIDRNRWFKRNRVPSIAIMVQVPNTHNLDIKTAGGSIEIGDLDGEIVAKTVDGSIRIGATEGDVTARSRGGSIRIGPTDGGVTARSRGGSIRIGPTDGGVYVKTLSGCIDIGETKGNVDAKTLIGSIRVGRTEGDVTARSLGGNIIVEATSGKVWARTLGGTATGYNCRKVWISFTGRR